MGSSLEASLDLALRMADRADAMALAAFGRSIAVERKPDGTPVTDVDRSIEATLRAIIDEEQPDAGVLGEEFGEKPGAVRWVIDPIDGTAFFMGGDPRFSVLVALESPDGVALGVVSAPALGLRWWAGAGIGAFASNDGAVSAARVSGTERLAGAAALLIGGSRFRTRGIPGIVDPAAAFDRLEEAGIRPAPLSASWEAVRVADGEFDLALTSGSWWDVAPLAVIVTEAGGASFEQGRGNGHVGVVLTNATLGAAVTELL